MRIATLATFAVVSVLVGFAGCARDHEAPARLVDGSPASPPSVGLDTSAPQIVTRVTAMRISTAASGSLVRRCVATAAEAAPEERAIVRVGVTGFSVTYRSRSALRACDGDAGGVATNRWCGRSYGRLARERLLDPRLDVAGCRTPGNAPVAFAWFEPGARSSYVAVRQPGYVEVYPVVGRLPVRISTTSGIDDETSVVRFRVSEHDSKGRLLGSSTLDAHVSG